MLQSIGQGTSSETCVPVLEEDIVRSDSEQWQPVVGMVPRLGRTSRGVRRGAQALAPVPQKHGHGGPSIMERFKRMSPPSFKGESQPLLAESWMRVVEKIFWAIRCAKEDKVSLATYMLQTLDEALSAACRQESEMDQYIEEKRTAQKRSAPPFQRQDKKKAMVYQ
ncbi:hypothetical protein Taro_040267 [Colocasia esculenta]|uniref:Uncharacterized protein n=1 Tax=Colocasia esculenta TaxID=4460 RepID=A0A843WLC4_COLES|nr:hypothetical protein [Colocasia esculenta]